MENNTHTHTHTHKKNIIIQSGFTFQWYSVVYTLTNIMLHTDRHTVKYANCCLISPIVGYKLYIYIYLFHIHIDFHMSTTGGDFNASSCNTEVG